MIVAEGQGGQTPWEQVQGQMYARPEDFVARHQPDRLIAEVPRRQTQAQRPSLAGLFPERIRSAPQLLTATRHYGNRLVGIAPHFGVHDATVNR